MKSRANKIITILSLALLLVSLSSCKDENSAESIANDACSCLLKSGFSMASNQGDSKNDMPECAQELTDRLHTVLDPMSDEEKAAFTREILKALLDTSCVDFLIKQMGHQQVMNFIFNWLGQ